MTRAIKTNLRLTFPGGSPLSHGKAELMELIRETGSIRQAAQRMDMSYRRGWLLTDELNRMFREPVVATKHGGKSGGGAVLTEFGTALLARFRDMEIRTQLALKADLDWLEANAQPPQDPSAEV
ncbi:winged helix-turn-helix domain-containing protein [Rhizobium sp. KVB221]|uniref:Winged helix-turn-helix domain-containing protein n=1 Tax=Rhizobium setariae TaxID=2801340 RepID=A0A936YIL4_9HYPH|nr:winged helix-turn-helix domain-containing protein [Rhizobium setariae]MBL0370783.1 winged helix-turn-helix domain-containing protein [Rhizobium setariae]